MSVVAGTLELIAYTFRIVLLIEFWLIVFVTTYSWANISSDTTIVKKIKALTDPVLNFLRNKFPYLNNRGFDLTPVLTLFIIVLLHLIVVDTLLGIAVRLK